MQTSGAGVLSLTRVQGNFPFTASKAGSRQIVQRLDHRRPDPEIREPHLQTMPLGAAAHRTDKIARCLRKRAEAQQRPSHPVLRPLRPRIRSTRLRRSSAANIGPTRFHQSHTFFAADLDTAFMQQVLHVAKRQRETNVEHHCQADDVWGCLEVAQGLRGVILGRYPGDLMVSKKFF